MKLPSAASALLPAVGVMLLWPYVFAKSVSSSSSLAAGQGEVRSHVVRRSTETCDSLFDNYCMNNGKCMLLVDINEHHCICDRGFYGPRCSKLDLVVQPLAEEEIILTIFCVSLLVIGLLGVLYFCCKWYKKNRFQSQPKHQESRVPIVPFTLPASSNGIFRFLNENFDTA